jgi:hypothetical protein
MEISRGKSPYTFGLEKAQLLSVSLIANDVTNFFELYATFRFAHTEYFSSVNQSCDGDQSPEDLSFDQLNKEDEDYVDQDLFRALEDLKLIDEFRRSQAL